MVRLNYQRLSPVAIDEIWVRLRAGHAVKPTARALGLPMSTVRAYLLPGKTSCPKHACTQVKWVAARLDACSTGSSIDDLKVGQCRWVEVKQ